MSLQAYQQAQRATESPRDTEYRLFGQVTRGLMDAQGLGKTDKGLIDALDRNRRLWSVLSADCASSNNQLPVDLRARIISLAIWVNKYSSSVLREGAEMEPLIEINRTIMQGLQAGAQAAAAAEQ